MLEDAVARQRGGQMARPLTKHTRNGYRYTRPANIEAVIDATLALELAGTAAAYLRS